MAFMHQQHALREAQKIVAEWLVPDGITAEQALERLIPILDNHVLVHEQRLFDEPYKDWLKHRQESEQHSLPRRLPHVYQDDPKRHVCQDDPEQHRWLKSEHSDKVFCTKCGEQKNG